MITKELQEITQNIIKNGRIPINGGIELLSNCNFKCVHCYNAMEKQECMSFEFASNIANQLEKLGTMHVFFTGGEVLLHPQFEKIYKYFRNKGIAVSILTNISLLNDRYINLFEEYTPYDIDISLYGITNKTYESVTGIKRGFELVERNILKLVEHKINFSLKTVILKENIYELEEMIKFANKFNKKLKIYTDIRPLNNGNPRTKEHQISLDDIIEVEKTTGKWKKTSLKNGERRKEREKRREQGYLYFCELGKYNFFITYEGILHGCVKERIHGYNLKEISIADGFNRMLNDVVLKKTEQFNKCSICRYIKYCEYCPAQFELETGDILTPPADVCELAKTRYLVFE